MGNPAIGLKGRPAGIRRTAGFTLDPPGDLSVDAASIAHVWAGDGSGNAGASRGTIGRPTQGMGSFQAQLRESDGRVLVPRYASAYLGRALGARSPAYFRYRVPMPRRRRLLWKCRPMPAATADRA